MKVKVITKPLFLSKVKGKSNSPEFYISSRIEDGKRTAYSIMSNIKGK